MQFVKVNRDFSNIIVDMNGTKVCMKGCRGVTSLSLSPQVHTCTPAMGDSFASGTIDGPGAFSFHQSNNIIYICIELFSDYLYFS